jgi:DNA polymerase III delta prime subunit
VAQPGVNMRAVKPETDWSALRHEVLETFTPGPPINDVAEFSGRKATIQRLQDIAVERARHAIIFGERGVGKTSLANIFYKDLNTATRKVRVIPIDADSSDVFDSLWRKVFRRIKWEADDYNLDTYYPAGTIEPDNVFLELAKFKGNELPIIIIDEYDRISSEQCRVLMTDLIKAMSRIGNNPTLILVGVADSILQLVRDHQSISRNLVQVPMHRMTNDEIKEVISSRVRRLRMKISDDALWRVTYFSAGLPFYAHSLGKYAALRAVAKERLEITEDFVLESLADCIADVDYTVAESYTRATERIYRKGNIFAQVLTGCALAENNDLGQFPAVAVEGPLSGIMGEPYEVPAFSFHLNQLTTPERGSVLLKTGARRTFMYSFAEPAMQPFIIMKSLQDGILKKDVLDKFAIKRQKELFAT